MNVHCLLYGHLWNEISQWTWQCATCKGIRKSKREPDPSDGLDYYPANEED